MIEAKKNLLFEKIFSHYNRNLLRRKFSSLLVSNFEILHNIEREIPLIIYANHSSWWDGLVAFQISQAANLESFVMMEEKNLKKLFLFRRLGAFSVDRENARKALKSIEYAAGLLNDTEKITLWIFPQGEILPNNLRPIFFYNGLTRILARTKRCYVLPAAFRFEFSGDFKPAIFVKFGDVQFFEPDTDFQVKSQTKIFADNLTTVLENLKSDIVNRNFSDYLNII